MPDPAFLITVDTEGDNLWAAPRDITTRNASYLPRFQALAERHGFRPVYLTNYEMVCCEPFVEFARDVLARNAGEVGMHLHAWNSPPLDALTDDDFRFQPYLIEYPDALMKAKITRLTDMLEDRFDTKMVSHRAGRWGFDPRYAAMLLAHGYRIDCSVTPGVDWGGNPGDPAGKGGTDYSRFPTRPYFLAADDISRPGEGGLLEVPVTIRPSCLYRIAPWAYDLPVVRSAAWRIAPRHAWMCPAESRPSSMLRVARTARREGASHVELALHSSELMPGGSPSFRFARDVERLYVDLEALFAELAGFCRGLTLKEFHAEYATGALQS